MLLEAAEGTHCSLECLDDVAEESPENGVRLVQSKSALTSNPVADRAKSLWKTLSNWLDFRLSANFPTGKTIFEIYVSRPVDGRSVRAFHDATSTEQVIAAIALAREELWGKGPEYSLRSSLSSDMAKYVNRVLEAETVVLGSILCDFRLVCGSGSPNADLEALIRTHPVRASKVPRLLTTSVVS